MAKAISAAVPPRNPFNPNHSEKPQRIIDDTNPIRPSAIIALRPRLSERCAHRGAQMTHKRADQL